MENVQPAETNGTPETPKAPATNGASATSKALMSAEQVKVLLDNIEKNSPARWPAAVRTLTIKAFESINHVSRVAEHLFQAVVSVGSDLEALRTSHGRLTESHRQLAAVVIALQKGDLKSEAAAPVSGTTEAAVNATQEAEAPPADAVGATPGVSDATLPQDEVEAAMDAAIAASDGKGPAEATAPEPVTAPSTGSRRRR